MRLLPALLGATLLAGMGLSHSALAQAVPLGIAIEADGNCPATPIYTLLPATQKMAYGDSKGWLCVDGTGGGGGGSTTTLLGQSTHGVDIGGVEGLAADGSAISGYPVRVAGADGGSLTRTLLTDTTGRLVIAPIAGTFFQTTQPVSIAPTATSATAVAPVSTSTAPTSGCLVVKASAGNLFTASGVAPAAGYIMVFNAASAPANGTVTPTNVIQATAAGTWSLTFPAFGQFMSTGITICDSSTGPYSLTAVTSGVFITGQAQ